MEKLFFSKLKEDRDWYFVEYGPPLPQYHFAMLSITTPSTQPLERVIDAIECEFEYWLNRYPVPLMISAFDELGDLYDLSAFRDCNHATGFIDTASGDITIHWQLLSNDEFPAEVTDTNYLKKIYSDITYKTQDDINKDLGVHIEQVRRLKWFTVFWVVIIPVCILIVQQFGPYWISAIAFVYGLWKAYDKWLRLTGKKKKSEREIAREEKEQRMRHQHYHCELNPDGFNRLKIENFDKESRDRIREEAIKLKHNNVI